MINGPETSFPKPMGAWAVSGPYWLCLRTQHVHFRIRTLPCIVGEGKSGSPGAKRALAGTTFGWHDPKLPAQTGWGVEGGAFLDLYCRHLISYSHGLRPLCSRKGLGGTHFGRKAAGALTSHPS